MSPLTDKSVIGGGGGGGGVSHLQLSESLVGSLGCSSSCYWLLFVLLAILKHDNKNKSSSDQIFILESDFRGDVWCCSSCFKVVDVVALIDGRLWRVQFHGGEGLNHTDCPKQVKIKIQKLEFLLRNISRFIILPFLMSVNKKHSDSRCFFYPIRRLSAQLFVTS